jgi:hypothetical protein
MCEHIFRPPEYTHPQDPVSGSILIPAGLPADDDTLVDGIFQEFLEDASG